MIKCTPFLFCLMLPAFQSITGCSHSSNDADTSATDRVDDTTTDTQEAQGDTESARPPAGTDTRHDSATDESDTHTTAPTDVQTDDSGRDAHPGAADSESPQDTLPGAADTEPTDTASNDTADDSTDTSGSDVDTSSNTTNWCDGSGAIPHTSADILLVVDNSRSMLEEQHMLATALFTLVNALAAPVDDHHAPISDLRIAVTTTDMGVSWDGQPYEGDQNTARFDNSQVKCAGLGDNGAFVTEFGENQIRIQEDVIACDSSATQCPPDWLCENRNTDGIGVCTDPNGSGDVPCPSSPGDLNSSFVDEDRANKAIATACLAGTIGIDGCNYEQQLKAAAAGLTNSGDSFMRADSLTAIVVVSDEDDCSIGSSQWHELEELATVDANVACGRHTDLLNDIATLKTDYEAAKIAAGGTADDLVFAAIGGVPMVDACQGTGDNITDCLNTTMGVNGAGTVGAPDEVKQLITSGFEQTYFEYACERYVEEVAVTSAFPGTRYVQMVQSFGKKGYMYSICNSDWAPAMENIADVVQDNVRIICLE